MQRTTECQLPEQKINDTQNELVSRSEARLTLRRLILAIAALGVMLWLLYLFFQTGHTWDESEHAHVAWLMSQGKRPLVDFFQHHQPLLWDLLSLYYRAGFHGAGVLIWGRILVGLCGITCLWALLLLGSGSKEPRVTFAGAAGAMLFIAITLRLPELFVSRPETLSITALLVALVLWDRHSDKSILPILTAGALAGAACYTSPRFLLCGGFFLLMGSQTSYKWLLLATGGLLFVLSYTLLADFPFERVIFNLQFSAYLQSVGDGPQGAPWGFWSSLGVTLVLPLLPLLLTLAKSDYWRGVLLVANLALIYIACDRLAGMFEYSQAYAPFLFSTTVVAVWLGRKMRYDSTKSILCVVASGALTIGTVNVLAQETWLRDLNLLELVRDRDRLSAMTPPGRTVLLLAPQHPITVLDTSYYVSPLSDAQDRLCRAVRGFHGHYALPPCDYLQDLQRGRPYMVDKNIPKIVKVAEIPAVEPWLNYTYRYKILDETATSIIFRKILLENPSTAHVTLSLRR